MLHVHALHLEWKSELFNLGSTTKMFKLFFDFKTEKFSDIQKQWPEESLGIIPNEGQNME